jgi:flagellar secretion chaperone FliS
MMPTSTFASPAGVRSRLATYARLEVETQLPQADPHRLILMLMDGFLEAVARARGAMRDGHVQFKGESIGKAIRIIDEGLRCALDLKQGGKLAGDLDSLYRYITERLTHANLRNDEAALQECAELLRPVREAWAAITPPQVTNVAS